MDKKNKRFFLLDLTFIIIFVLALTWASVRYGPQIMNVIKDPDQFRELLLSYGAISVPVFLLFHVLQVVIAVIPGEFVQVAGGYVYGTFWGTVYSLIGVLLGSCITFYISRLLGFSLVKRLVSTEKFEKYEALVNNPKSEALVFLLFLIPGLPKDLLVYVVGLSPMKPLRFFIIFTIGRLPALIGSSFIGANLQKRDYLSAIIMATVACVLFAIGILYKDRLVDWIKKLTHRHET